MNFLFQAIKNKFTNTTNDTQPVNSIQNTMQNAYCCQTDQSGVPSQSTAFRPANAINARRISPDDSELKQKPPCAVIATFRSGSSYDALFQKIQQVSPDPECCVVVFSFNFMCLQHILDRLCNDTTPASFNAVIEQFVDCVSKVEKDSVLFNFECCSDCSERGFHNSDHKTQIMELLRWIISNQHTAMFGDFTLKSLIADWDSSILGPNPFVNLGSCSASISLRFDPSSLQTCPNAQLQNVAQLCDEGHAILQAPANTIVYSVLSERPTTLLYDLSILTIADKCGGFTLPLGIPALEMGSYQGTAGHVLLKYSTGASIFTSAGHWLALSHINATEEGLIKATETQFGKDFSDQIKNDLSSMSCETQKNSYILQNARYVVQSSAPCNYSKNYIDVAQGKN